MLVFLFHARSGSWPTGSSPSQAFNKSGGMVILCKGLMVSGDRS